jgi:hypothetical protein
MDILIRLHQRLMIMRQKIYERLHSIKLYPNIIQSCHKNFELVSCHFELIHLVALTIPEFPRQYRLNPR